MAKSNLVGTVVPTEEQVDQSVAGINEVYAKIRPWGTMLSSDERVSFLKPRTGSERAMELVCELARELGLSIPALSLENLSADLKVGKSARKLEDVLENTHQLAADTRTAAYGEAWEAFLGYYAILSSMASRNAELAKKLQPVVEFMANGPRRKATVTEPAK